MIAARALAALLALSSPALSEEWVCIPDQAAGFKWLNGRWTQTTFNVSDHTYIISSTSPDSYSVTATGSQYPDHRCLGFTESELLCGDVRWSFVFNKTTMRYQEHYGFGYTNGGDSVHNTPFVEIGRCSPLR